MTHHADRHKAEVKRRLDGMHLQKIEGNPLTATEVAMFEMFEREDWSQERRLTHILSQVGLAAAAE